MVSRGGSSKLIVALFVGVFALTPIVVNYSISSMKDTLFAYVLLAWMPFLHDIATSKDNTVWAKKSTYVALGFSMAFTALVRSNGIIISVAVGMALLVFFEKDASGERSWLFWCRLGSRWPRRLR